MGVGLLTVKVCVEERVLPAQSAILIDDRVLGAAQVRELEREPGGRDGRGRLVLDLPSTVSLIGARLDAGAGLVVR